MGADRVRNIVNEGLRREIEGLRRMLGFQDDSGCVYDRVNDDQLHYEKHVCVDDISDLDESNLPLALCEDLLSLERAGGLEVAATPSLALRSQFGVDKLFSQMPLYLWPREAGILSLFGIPGLVHPGVPGVEDPDVTQWSLASASPFSNRETCLLLGAPQNMHSCPVSDEKKTDTACQEEELQKEDESLLPLVLWQDPSAYDRPCPVEGRHSGPDYPSEDQSCPMLLAAQNTESCPVSDEGNLQINGEDEDIPKEDESLLALVLWQDPSSQYLPRPVAVTQSGHDDPSEDQTCATLLASQNTQSSPVSDKGGSEKKGEDEDIPDASKVSSTAVESPPSHPVSPSHSHSHPSVVIRSDSDERNMEINGEDENIPKENESLLALVLWQDPSSQYLPRPIAVTQSGHDDPSEDPTCATLLASQNTQLSPVSDEGGSEKKGEDEDIPDASKVSSTAVESPPSHPVSPSHSHSHSHPSVVIRSDSDVEIPTGSPPAPRPRKRGEKHTGGKTPCRLRRLSRIVSPTLRVDENSSEQMSGPAPCSSGEQSSCGSTNQRKQRLSAIISQPLPNWEPPVIEVHTDDIRASSQQVLDETALARQRQRELWVRNPYSNPLGRGNLSTGPSEEAYAHFKRDSKVLYRNVGLEVMQTQDFFISLEDNDSHLLDTHVDAYLNLLNKMRGTSKTSSFVRNGNNIVMAIDQTGAVHGIPVTRWWSPVRLKTATGLFASLIFCYGRSRYMIPRHTGYPKAVPTSASRFYHSDVCSRLFACRQVFFNRTGRRTYDSTPMKAHRMNEKQVPTQISPKSNGVVVLLMIRSLLRGLKCVKTAERDIQSHRQDIAYEIFTNSLPEGC
ncbi:hypothetical protein LWI29_012758 [Acer saccharum]|uniref:Uncharacterized protein n=1 Tax=Acer saccharum TaxID=4024 RepID=A0AA39VQL6_ACESA|nr:hypothetical protein LWI29_012758 [Acer saccharum]